jgi:hypothetical protein
LQEFKAWGIPSFGADKFMDQLVPGEPNAIIALELADLAIQENFVRLREPGCVPPWPRVNDIMYCCMDWKQPLKVELLVIRQVILPRYLRNEGIGDTVDDIDDNDHILVMYG